jgi:hypothetical protein
MAMGYVICGARTRSGMPCKAAAVAYSERCHLHGGLCTGPRTAMGKARNGFTLRLYRINGPGKGFKHYGETKRRRELAAQRNAMLSERQERRAKRLEHWRRRKAVESGLPLYCEALGSSDSDDQSSGSSGNEAS